MIISQPVEICHRFILFLVLKFGDGDFPVVAEKPDKGAGKVMLNTISLHNPAVIHCPFW
jgi:hypothetical protein